MEKVSETSSDRSAPASRRALSWPARLCALAGAIVCSGFAAPGAARAAGSPGIDGLSDQIQAAALSEVDAALGAPTGDAPSGDVVESAARAIVATFPSTASGAAQPTPPATDAARTAPLAFESASTAPIAPDAASPATTPLSTLSSEPASLAAALVEAARWGDERAAVQRSGRFEPPHSTAQAAARQSSHVTEFSLSSSASVESSVHSDAWTSVQTRTELSAGAGSRARSPGARGRQPDPAGARVPQPLPPAPIPPRPDLSSSGQAGGQGLLLPLVIAALAAVLGLFAFQRLPRMLPRSAFRKPRRLALRPWRPG